MKKKRITYGVKGMMEYQAVIKVGRNNMKVQFSDGSASAMGQNPATFTTENFMVQHAIENSSDFKRGRIKVINTIELEEELRIERNSSQVENVGTDGIADGGELKIGNGEVAALPSDVAAETDTVTTQVEFSCNDDAKDYLEQTFGYIRSKLRNREDIVAAGKAHGVEIIFE